MAKLTPALTLVVCLTSLGAGRAEEIAKPVGKWERKIGKSHVTLMVEENRLHATFVGDKPCVLHADYSMTRDGVIFGVVTSIECEEDEDSARSIFDAPFSCRFRLDEGALIVHDLKCHEVDSKDDTWNGRFKAVSAAPSRPSVVPTSYSSPVGYPTYPSGGSPYNAPPPPPSAGSSNSSPATPATPSVFNFYSGFVR